MAKDRFHAKRQRVRQSEAIVADAEEQGAALLATDEYRRVEALNSLETSMRDPMFEGAPSPYINMTVQALRRGEYLPHYGRLARNLEKALSCRREGLPRRERKADGRAEERKRKWYANKEAFDTMCANRPLKPPGR